MFILFSMRNLRLSKFTLVGFWILDLWVLVPSSAYSWPIHRILWTVIPHSCCFYRCSCNNSHSKQHPKLSFDYLHGIHHLWPFQEEDYNDSIILYSLLKHRPWKCPASEPWMASTVPFSLCSWMSSHIWIQITDLPWKVLEVTSGSLSSSFLSIFWTSLF